MNDEELDEIYYAMTLYRDKPLLSFIDCLNKALKEWGVDEKIELDKRDWRVNDDILL